MAAVLILLSCAAAALLWSVFPNGSVPTKREGIIVLPGAAMAPRPAGQLPTAAASPSLDSPGARFGAGLGLVPSYSNDRLAGYAITADADPKLLATTKLRQGDLLLDMDGRPLDPRRVEGLAQELASADALEVTFEREGQLRKRVIDFTR